MTHQECQDRLLEFAYGELDRALAAAVEPEIVTRAETRHVSVELHGTQTRGQTVVDWHGLTQNAPNTEIILEVDQQRFIQLMENGLK